MTNAQQNLHSILDAALHAALLSLANDNVGADVQGLLLHGFDKLNTKPNSLRNAIAAAFHTVTLRANKRDAAELVNYLIKIEGQNRRIALDAAAMITHLSMADTKPFDVADSDGSMTPEEHRLEELKQMAAYSGKIVSFEVNEPYYLASCNHCGWVGSSELCGTDSFGDDSDVYCPRCHSSGADCGEVAERINCQSVDVAAVRRQAFEVAATLIDEGFEKKVGKAWRNDGKPSKNDKCPHDKFMYEDCEHCASAAIRALSAEPAQVEQWHDMEALAALSKLTFVIRHNPNCPHKFLIRLVGKSGFIDLKPYRDQLGTRQHETGDIIGSGKTLYEAYIAATAVPTTGASQ